MEGDLEVVEGACFGQEEASYGQEEASLVDQEVLVVLVEARDLEVVASELPFASLPVFRFIFWSELIVQGSGDRFFFKVHTGA